MERKTEPSKPSTKQGGLRYIDCNPRTVTIQDQIPDASGEKRFNYGSDRKD